VQETQRIRERPGVSETVLRKFNGVFAQCDNADDKHGTRDAASKPEAAGVRPVTVLVSEQDIDFLLARGYDLKRTDSDSVSRAVSAFLTDSALEGA
jgi:hypothetical protein